MKQLFEVTYRAGSIVLAVLVVVQAAMAGQFLFGDGGISIHGVLGNIGFAVAAATAVAALLARRAVLESVVGGAVVVAMTAQLGLGYSARSALEPAAWHIPLGVIVFGLMIYQLVLAWPAVAPNRPSAAR